MMFEKICILVGFLPKGLMDWLLGMTPLEFKAKLDTWDVFYGDIHTFELLVSIFKLIT